MTLTEALVKIVENQKNPSLNYAIEYAKGAMHMYGGNMLEVQCLYILNNLSGWRYNKKFDITSETIGIVKKTIRDAAGLK
jgi:hypothetical protein